MQLVVRYQNLSLVSALLVHTLVAALVTGRVEDVVLELTTPTSTTTPPAAPPAHAASKFNKKLHSEKDADGKYLYFSWNV